MNRTSLYAYVNYAKVQETFGSPNPSKQALRPTQPPNQWVPGYFPGEERHEHETDHLPPSSTAPKGTKLTGPKKLWCRNGLNPTVQTMMFMILTMYIFTLGEKIDSGSITSCIEVIRQAMSLLET